MAKKAKKARKSGPNILPMIVLLIIGFLAYKANPEYWQQGKLIEDWKKGGVQKVEETEIANIPEEDVEEEPDIDPDVSYDGSIKGSKTIPVNINKSIDNTDPVFGFMRTRFRVIYLVQPDSDRSKQMLDDLTKGRKEYGLNNEYIVESLLYSQADKKQRCGASEAQAFLCEVCDKKICIINPKKKEYITVQPSATAALKQAQNLSGDNW